ncbi:MAG: DUF885 family protein [Spirochaetes bacterium]|nr:DUF885 family protein [Spirochaetota bacterium]MBU1081144.1 DUF885 family protein [Spirochaetota bacterium]
MPGKNRSGSSVKTALVKSAIAVTLAAALGATACRSGGPGTDGAATPPEYGETRPEAPRWTADRGTALVVMDVQEAYTPVVSQAAVFRNIQALVAAADEAGAPVFWVYTDSDASRMGSRLFELSSPFVVGRGHERVVKTGQNAFSGTGLIEALKEAGAGRLVFCGLASDQCVKTSVENSAALGYRTVVASDAHTVPRGGGGAAAMSRMNDLWRADPRIELMPAASVDFDGRPLSARGLGAGDWIHSEAFSRFLDSAYRPILARSPEAATQLGLSSWAGLDDTGLDGLSAEYSKETGRLEKEALEALEAYGMAGASQGDRLSYDATRRALSDSVSLRRYADLAYLVNPTVFGVAYSAQDLFSSIHPLKEEADARSYVARLSGLGAKIDEATAFLARAASKRATAPRVVLESSLPDIRLVASGSPKGTVFYESLARGLGAMPGLDAAAKEGLLSEAERVIGQAVIPAYGRLADETARRIEKAPEEIGLWKVPGGDEYYRALLAAKTTTGLAPDEIHEMGLAALARIHAEIVEAGSRTERFRGDTAAEVVGKAFGAAGAVGAGDALEGYRDLLAAAEARARPLFPDYPAAPVGIAAAPQGGYYQPGAIDGSTPGVFYVASGAGANRAGMPTLLHHETVPGHHLQIASSAALDLPVARKLLYFEAYVEGWALYAERLMAEEGAYADDPAGDIGRLQAEAFRAARLVVDTGIHDRRWSLGRAVDFMVEQGLLPRQAARFEVIRYASLPAQATTYYVGFLTILRLRDDARRELGEGFSLPAFHRTVLSCGPVPLDVLEGVVARWIAESKAERR